MNENFNALCDDHQMAGLLQLVETGADDAMPSIDRLLESFPLDPRLHFLKGSLLIGLKRFIGAHRSMSRAIEIAPDYHIARFQLGLFELTSGEAEAARQTWQPLDILPADHWMRLFVTGLNHLAEDRFVECAEALAAGIHANDENLPLNADMRLVIEQCESLNRSSPAPGDEQEEISATSFLLARKPGGAGR